MVADVGSQRNDDGEIRKSISIRCYHGDCRVHSHHHTSVSWAFWNMRPDGLVQLRWDLHTVSGILAHGEGVLERRFTISANHYFHDAILGMDISLVCGSSNQRLYSAKGDSTKRNREDLGLPTKPSTVFSNLRFEKRLRWSLGRND